MVKKEKREKRRRPDNAAQRSAALVMEDSSSDDETTVTHRENRGRQDLVLGSQDGWQDCWRAKDRKQAIIKGLDRIFAMAQNFENFESFGNDVIQVQPITYA